MAHKIDEEKELHGRKTVDRQFAVFRAAAGHRGVFQSQKRELENWNTDEEMKKKNNEGSLYLYNAEFNYATDH